MKDRLMLLLILLPASYAYSVGVSPDILTFDTPEKEILLFNQNPYDINFSMKGCEGIIETINSGTLHANIIRNLTLRHNATKEHTCYLDIFFENAVYTTALSVKVSIPGKIKDSGSFLDDLTADEPVHEQHGTPTDFTSLAWVSALFLAMLLIIVKYF